MDIKRIRDLAESVLGELHCFIDLNVYNMGGEGRQRIIFKLACLRKEEPRHMS